MRCNHTDRCRQRAHDGPGRDYRNRIPYAAMPRHGPSLTSPPTGYPHAQPTRPARAPPPSARPARPWERQALASNSRQKLNPDLG
eukprot:9387102-Alexandrium_andersonii.AAC.2